MTSPTFQRTLPNLSGVEVAALVIAHPGHELRVYHWLELTRPLVFILTDGSGRSGRSRLNSTTKILARAGAQQGQIYGRMTDQELYSALLKGDFNFFLAIAQELADVLGENHVEYVAGDAIEGYNPAHDLCRLIVNTAVEISIRRLGFGIGNYDFPLSHPPNSCPAELFNKAVWLRLEDMDLDRKLKTAFNYPELLPEVDNAISVTGIDAFRVECLRPVHDPGASYIFDELPFYERYGERQVSARYYQEVIRYREHLLPLSQALAEFARKSVL